MFPLNHKGSACKTNHIGVTCGQSGELRPGGRPPGEGCGERLGCRPLLSPAHFPKGCSTSEVFRGSPSSRLQRASLAPVDEPSPPGARHLRDAGLPGSDSLDRQDASGATSMVVLRGPHRACLAEARSRVRLRQLAGRASAVQQRGSAVEEGGVACLVRFLRLWPNLGSMALSPCGTDWPERSTTPILRRGISLHSLAAWSRCWPRSIR